MASAASFQLGGYVLAGGRSSRMGADKALLELAGKPLIHHAVAKLRRICAEVNILGSNPALAVYAPLVADLHPDCGPIGGMEAALAHSRFEWNLFLAVDMPFLPSAFLSAWIGSLHTEDDGARIRIFTADGRPQPGFCMVHKDVAPFLSDAIARGDRKLMRVFEVAGSELAERRGFSAAAGLSNTPVAGMQWISPADADGITVAQRAIRHLWFSNLNTPQDFAEAERHVTALDT